MMLDLVGAILPFGLGVSVSPIPIIVSVLILLSPRSRANGIAFLLGWAVGIAAVVTVLTLLAGYLPTDSSDGPNPVAGVLQLALGVWLLVMARRKFRPTESEPGPEAEIDPDTGLPVPQLPGWMSSIASTTPVRSLRSGLLFAGANPKNVAFAAGAALTIGTAGLGTGDVALLLVIYTVIASLTVAVPVGLHLLFPVRTEQPLRALEVWLMRNNTTIAVVLLLVYGVLLIGQGIGSF
ncbi:GAP family protein [Occultella kanbiaonis]|uniref:GAP family protein n=1 Tax=Occultella kanbiaonis TaxID=2675754 RepID=UPI0012BA2CFF|nr:GAP family protein [Occultella kanbiaonis]